MSKATIDELGDLHGAIAKKLKEQIETGEVSASLLKEAREFLKDNNIEATADNPEMKQLGDILPFAVVEGE